MKKCGAMIGLALCLMALLGGCAFRQVDELYTLPKLPGDYQNLQAKIEEVTGKGAEYSAPAGAQPVQFQDLDGDGTLEAIAFFKVTGDEKPLKIYIFRLTETGYEVGAVVEGDGNAVASIYYENLCGSATKELVVSWQKNTDVSTLMVYSIDRYEVSELLNVAAYTDYKLLDINMDNLREIMVISVGTVEGSSSRVDCYAADEASLAQVGSAPLSKDSAKQGMEIEGYYLKGETPIPALYVTSTLGEKVITDIFAWKDEHLENVTLNAENGVSTATIRTRDKARPADINLDSVLELPVPVDQPVEGLPALVAWSQYDINGTASLVYTTYHDFADGWYFVLPASWVGKVVVTSDSAVVGEKRTSFALLSGERTENFFTIYKLTGPNRHMRARLNERRFTLAADDTTIYCAEFTPGGWSSGLNEAAAKEQFKLSQNDWNITG